MREYLLCLVIAAALTYLVTPLARRFALWWGARLVILPWLRVWPELRTRWLRLGFVFLHAECATMAVVYGWLAGRAG